jgi:Xaa-Pro aminopeptidase
MENEKKETIKKRLGAVKEKMKSTSVDALLVTKEENKHYLSMFYSTNFELLITPKENYIITDFRYKEAAEELEPIYEVVITTSEYKIFDFLKDQGLEALGLEYKDVTMDFYASIDEAMPKMRVEAYDGLIEDIRVVKDETELSYIAKAEAIGDAAFTYILGEIKPGVSEKEIALKLELKMRELGAERLSFDTICVSGKNSSLPHGHPSDKLIEKGDFVTMDFGCIYNGYCSDMTRTVAVGSITDEQRKVYDTVLAAQLAVCDFIKAGALASDADKVARDIITAAGYGDCFGHGLGHGVGLEIHEAPVANPPSKDIFQKNMLITIEPGIYIPGKFGVRIEDLSIVTDGGIINLSTSKKDLIVI